MPRGANAPGARFREFIGEVPALAAIQRLQKTLESANIKLDSVITDIIGKTGQAMIQALIGG
jgi:hypothetical protein